ncbi:macrophage mannose receptor 1-like [Glandiceps talaboti]
MTISTVVVFCLWFGVSVIAADPTKSPAVEATPISQPTACLDGWTLHNDSCYRFFGYDSGKNHTQAELYCARQVSHVWSHLAVFEDPKEYEWAYDFIQKLDDFKMEIGTWIGITKDTKSVWKWANGANVTYGWAVNQPSGKDPCGCIRRDTGGYNDHNCSTTKQFFCEYERSGLPPPATVLPSPCPPGWGYHDYSCYKFIGYDNGQDYSKAETECNKLEVSSKPAAIADIQTADEYYYVYGFLEQQDNFHTEIGVWVGLRMVDSTWKWSDGTKMDYGEINLWAPDEPNGNGPCGSIHKDTGGFNDSPCHHTKQYLCEFELTRPTTKPPPEERHPCESGWIHWEGSCYYFAGSENVKEHGEAVTHCDSLHGGATLANLETREEYDWIEEEIKYRSEFDNKKHGTWIGLRRVSDKPTIWQWSNGKPLKYNNTWSVGNPSSESDSCVTIRKETQGFNDHGCDKLEQYVCEYEQPPYEDQVPDSSASKDFVILGSIVLAVIIIIAIVFMVRGYQKYCRKNRPVRVKYSGMQNMEPDSVDIRITENPQESAKYRDDISTTPYTDKPLV